MVREVSLGGVGWYDEARGIRVGCKSKRIRGVLGMRNVGIRMGGEGRRKWPERKLEGV